MKIDRGFYSISLLFRSINPIFFVSIDSDRIEERDRLEKIGRRIR